ncbi:MULTISPECIES: hypothetical protein [Amycolatopsis]|uniref:Uncharacterized protein n=1 Tax=Amycolatopsis dongchuanensis TaxID=1070866 RepID=A0ABP9Q527_9PSEU
MECPNCVADLDHCHGTLIVHTDEVVECSEPGCRDFDRVRHTFVVTCEEVDGDCHCTASLIEEYAQAS